MQIKKKLDKKYFDTFSVKKNIESYRKLIIELFI